MKIKQKYIVLIVLLLTISSIYYLNKLPNVSHCGIILNKYEGGRMHKYHMSDEYRIVVKYDDDFVEDIGVNANIYYKHEKQTRICLVEPNPNEGWFFLLSTVLFGLFLSTLVFWGGEVDFK